MKTLWYTIFAFLITSGVATFYYIEKGRDAGWATFFLTFFV